MSADSGQFAPHPRSPYLLLRSYLRRRKEDRVVRNQVSLLAQPKRQNPSMVAASRSRLGIAFAGWTSAQRRDPATRDAGPGLPRNGDAHRRRLAAGQANAFDRDRRAQSGPRPIAWDLLHRVPDRSVRGDRLQPRWSQRRSGRE